MKVLVSACLLGENCKYNGGNNHSQKLEKYLEGHEVISICPEVLAGMGVPRPSVEIVNGHVEDKDGNNYDEKFKVGINKALNLIQDDDIELVILQSRSPTCGIKHIYDGTFSGKLIDGSGKFARELVKRGYQVIDVDDIYK